MDKNPGKMENPVMVTGKLRCLPKPVPRSPTNPFPRLRREQPLFLKPVNKRLPLLPPVLSIRLANLTGSPPKPNFPILPWQGILL